MAALAVCRDNAARSAGGRAFTGNYLNSRLF
jgi:hypothetical protein